MIQVLVQPYDPKKSLLDLKRKCQREMLYPNVKLRRFFEPAFARKKRKQQESTRRRRKLYKKS